MKIKAIKGNHPTDYRIELSEVPDLIISEAVRLDKMYQTAETDREMDELGNMEIRVFAMIEVVISMEKPKITNIESKAATEEVYEGISGMMQLDTVFPTIKTIKLSMPC